MSDLQPSILAMLRTLEQRSVRYVLIGGVAMRCHGSSHLTDDIALYYSRDPETLAALAEVLAPLHPRLRGAEPGLPFRWDVRTLRSGLNFTLETDAGWVDVLGEVTGMTSFADVWERAVEVDFHGVRVRVASLDDLIAMKRAAARAKDQTHLLELERLRALRDEIGPRQPEGS